LENHAADTGAFARIRETQQRPQEPGFNFVGPTVTYAYMQAIGMVTDHSVVFSISGDRRGICPCKLMRTEHSMNTDVLSTRTIDGIAVITLGSAKRIYFDAEMGDALTQALEEFAGDANIPVVIITGGAPRLFQPSFQHPRAHRNLPSPCARPVANGLRAQLYQAARSQRHGDAASAETRA
jgi:hypothetical protein